MRARLPELHPRRVGGHSRNANHIDTAKQLESTVKSSRSFNCHFKCSLLQNQVAFARARGWVEETFAGTNARLIQGRSHSVTRFHLPSTANLSGRKKRSNLKRSFSLKLRVFALRTCVPPRFGCVQAAQQFLSSLRVKLRIEVLLMQCAYRVPTLRVLSSAETMFASCLLFEFGSAKHQGFAVSTGGALMLRARSATRQRGIGGVVLSSNLSGWAHCCTPPIHGALHDRACTALERVCLTVRSGKAHPRSKHLASNRVNTLERSFKLEALTNKRLPDRDACNTTA
eukprot:3443013-Amphidinium_carterae.1